MCGIVGYIGEKSIDSVLLVGLKKLEYRGYDSAGIAISNYGEISVYKNKGKISALENLVKTQTINGQLGIGHTRWATHGEPNQQNAHPHTNSSGTIAVVQNGIIENYQKLKAELIQDGYLFHSETDTEVIPFLVDQELKSKPPKKAFQEMLKRLEGKYAISMLMEADPNSIYFAKRGVPLILAKDDKDKDFFIASDLPAVVPIAQFAHYLEDGQWGFISKEKTSLFSAKGKLEKLSYHSIEVTSADIEKGGYPHFMLKEIYEQPKIFKRIIEARIKKNGKLSFPELLISNEYFSSLGRIVIQACGTSLNAGLLGKHYIENYCKISTDADFSSEFRYRNPVVGGDTLVIGISQSGETADTLAGLHEAKAKFLKVLSFLNNTKSTLARESDSLIDLMAGPEIGVASTKAYTAEVLQMLLFSLYLGSIKWVIDKKERGHIIEEIKTLPDKAEMVLKNVESIQKVANYLKDVSACIFLGRTYNYSTALEGALKLKEISYIHASGYAGGEFKHGPIALVSEETPVIVIVPQGDIRGKIFSNLMEVKARKGKIISIITENDQEIRELSDFVIEIPEIVEPLTPILAVLPLQLLAYYTAVYRGCDVDKPRNLAKSVTVE